MLNISLHRICWNSLLWWHKASFFSWSLFQVMMPKKCHNSWASYSHFQYILESTRITIQSFHILLKLYSQVNQSCPSSKSNQPSLTSLSLTEPTGAACLYHFSADFSLPNSPNCSLPFGCFSPFTSTVFYTDPGLL